MFKISLHFDDDIVRRLAKDPTMPIEELREVVSSDSSFVIETKEEAVSVLAQMSNIGQLVEREHDGKILWVSPNSIRFAEFEESLIDTKTKIRV